MSVLITNARGSGGSGGTGNGAKLIGYDHSVGGQTMGANDRHATRVYAGVTTTLNQLSLFISANGAGKNIVMGIYSQDNATGLPNVLLGQTAPYTTAVPTGATADGGLKYFDLLAPVNVVKGTAYWLVCHPDSSFAVETALNAVTMDSQKYRNVAYASSLGTVGVSTFGTPTGNSAGQVSMGGY